MVYTKIYSFPLQIQLRRARLVAQRGSAVTKADLKYYANGTGQIKMKKIVIVSDSHELIRPEIEKHLISSDYVIHAGDIGSAGILRRFKKLNSNSTFVRGNMDKGLYFKDAPPTNALSAGEYSFYVIHDLERLDLDPAGQFDFVIFGHSHRPEMYKRDGVVYLNPGSIGPKRNKLPISMAVLTVNEDGDYDVNFIEIKS